MFLSELEQEIDKYVGQVISKKGEVLYEQGKPQQLLLFEEMEKYLANKGMHADLA